MTESNFSLRVVVACLLGDHPALHSMASLTPCNSAAGCRHCTMLATYHASSGRLSWPEGSGVIRDIDTMKANAEEAASRRAAYDSAHRKPGRERDVSERKYAAATERAYNEIKDEGVIDNSEFWRLDTLYTTYGTRFSSVTDLAIDGMHVVSNILKSVMTHVHSNLNQAEQDKVDTRLACVMWPYGRKMKKPWRASLFKTWSVSTMVNFWCELCLVSYEDLVGENEWQLILATHEWVKGVWKFEINRDDLTVIKKRSLILQRRWMQFVGWDRVTVSFHMIQHLHWFMQRFGPLPTTWSFTSERKNHWYHTRHTNYRRIEVQYAMEEARRVNVVFHMNWFKKCGMLAHGNGNIAKQSWWDHIEVV
eukprot:TRINITY_DN1990_c0_g4_i1.p1 TRINITY_DN1990_c0_g4~~TRINITY_DN1990_c0_g4_i1.p1  ORF type:complete len:364 (-),score=-33.20 TRINITY_DN1990_c0_g4_i1:354-1445(-)